MTKSSSTADAGRQWIWLALPPLAAMLGAAVTIYLAVSRPDPLVATTVQKLGKALVHDNRAAQTAQDLGLNAVLSRIADGGDIALRLDGRQAPERLHLLWIHPTRSEQDRGAILLRQPAPAEAVVPAAGALYQGTLPVLPAERGIWILQDEAGSWQLEARADTTMGEFTLRPVLR